MDGQREMEGEMESGVKRDEEKETWRGGEEVKRAAEGVFVMSISETSNHLKKRKKRIGEERG